MRFRIRWAVVKVLNNHNYFSYKQRMCIAEAEMRFLFWKIWWPIGNWRKSEPFAKVDIELYKRLHDPLPETKVQE